MIDTDMTQPAGSPDMPARDPRLNAVLDRASRALRAITATDSRLAVIATAAADLERTGGDKSDAVAYLHDLAIDAHGLDPDGVQAAIGRGVSIALDERARDARPTAAPSPPPLRDEPPPISLDDYGGAARASPSLPLRWLDISRWDDEREPERRWTVRDRIPAGQAGIFSGEGGTGKSLIELHRDVAHVMGLDWLESMPERGPAIYVGAEDSADEIHIRLCHIVRHCQVRFADLIAGGLHVLPLLGQDATLCAPRGKSGAMEPTPLYHQLYQAAGDIRPRNISIDTLSHAYAGSEIDRVQVYGFMRHMQALAAVAGGSVTVLAHPSLSGMASGTGTSGSTAWHGAARYRMYLTSAPAKDGAQPDPELRHLEWRKNQYGPRAETMLLRFRCGLFLPAAGASPLDRAAQEARTDDVFLALLARYARENRRVSASTGTGYAPALFAKEEEAASAGMTNIRLAEAMRRLFAAGRIRNDTVGPPSRQRTYIVSA
jgi:RecA-family ATPase